MMWGLVGVAASGCFVEPPEDMSTSSSSGGGAVCGDGVVDEGEACDDGNEVNGDACNRDCRASHEELWSWSADGDEEADGDDYGAAVAAAADGKVAAVGTIFVNGIFVAWTGLFSPTGEKLWEVTLSGPDGGPAGATSVAFNDAGDVLVGGYYDVMGGSIGTVIRLRGDDGEFVWQKDTCDAVTPSNVDSYAEYNATAALRIDGSSVLVACNQQVVDGADAVVDGYAKVLTYDAVGGGALGVETVDVAPMAFNGIYAIDRRGSRTVLCGESRAADGHQDAWVQMRLGSETLWTLGIGSGLAPDGTDEWAVGCSFDDADGVAVLFGSYHPGLGSTDAHLSLVNAQGSTIQKILLVEPLHDGTHEPRALARDGDGALVMVGGVDIDDFTDEDMWIHKRGSDGSAAWTVSGAGFGIGWDSAGGVAIAPDGSVVVVGSRQASGFAADLWLGAYSP